MGTIGTDVNGSVSSARDSELEAGHQVGEYVIESKLGEGGFGTVFRASHPLIGKLAAVKVLARQYSADPEMVSRFVAEARAVNQIRHRNIIDIFAFGQLDDGRHYYTMELLDGEPLDRFIAQSGGCALEVAIPILREVARALDAAHAAGIAHRDLKPENIFLARDNEGRQFPKLLDFGIAKLVGTPSADTKHRTRTGAPIGTPYYMSPEQCRGRDVDHRTDIYSFGCLAYELLTGKVPFDAEDHLSILMKQTLEEPEPPSTIVELPDGIDDAIAWMMKKDPAERAPDLASAVAAMEEAATAAGIPIDAPPSRPSHRAITPVPRASSKPTPSTEALAPTMTPSSISAPMPVKRSRRGLWLGIVAVAVAAAAATVVLMNSTQESEAKPPQTIVIEKPAPVQPPIVITEPAPKPELVTVEVAGPPPGTQAFGPNGPLGPVPGPVQLPKGEDEVQLTFTADGYITATARIMPDADGRLTVELAKKKAAPVAKKPAHVVKKPPPPPTTKPASGGSAVVVDPYSRK